VIDVDALVRSAVGAGRLEQPLLAAPFDLPSTVCARLVDEGVIAGYVGDGAPANGMRGRWVDRQHGRWEIERRAARALLFLGTRGQIGTGMLLAAQRAGIATVGVLDASGGAVETFALRRFLWNRLKAALLNRLISHERLGKVVERRLSFSSNVYDEAFAALYEFVGDRFRMPASALVADRVLIVLGSLGPGGAERQAALTAAGIAASGHYRPVVGCSFTEGEIAGFHRGTLERADVPVETVLPTPPGMSAQDMLEVLEWSQAYRHIGFQNVVHIVLSYVCFIRAQKPAVLQTWMDYCNVLAGIAGDLVGIPRVILSGRSVAPDHFAIFQPYMRPGYRALLRRPDVVFTNNSEAGARDYARWLDVERGRIAVVHNGLDFPACMPAKPGAAVRDALGIALDAPIVGGVIRFSEEKRPKLWLDAALRLVRRDPELRCVVFGDGVLLAEMRDYVAKQGMQERILLPGLVRDVWSALAIMDVFLLTSRMEGLPNVLIEAQAAGVPVVTTGAGGMKETYLEGETGWTAPSDTPEAIAETIRAALADPARLGRASARAREYVRETFGTERMIEQTMTLIGGSAPAARERAAQAANGTQ
jgi:glycosyltransferase involved in cell wall biosynthesis